MHGTPRSATHLATACLLAGLLAGFLACGNTGQPAATSAAPPADDEAGEPAPTPAPTQAGGPAAPDPEACRAVAGWRGEIIELPPEFAPSLPAGKEDLRFAPGMFDAEAADYFTYAFVLAFDGSPDLTAAGLQTILDAYYRGLIAAVARSKERDLPTDDIASRVTRHGDGFRAEVAIHDAFVTGEPLTLHMDLAVTGTCVKVRTSPQPRDHAVWQDLTRAVDCLSCAVGN